MSELATPAILNWTLLPDVPNPEASLRAELDLLDRLALGEGATTGYLVRHPRCLVVTRREASFAGFDRARQVLAGEGWPVAVRASGGSCVPQGPGMLNVGLVFPRPAGWSLEQGYRLICDSLAAWLRTFGIEAVPGEVPGSFCDGRYNLQVAGRKLVGTAQRVGGAAGHQAVLVHACILNDVDVVETTEAVNRFYRLCGQNRRFDPDACTSLRQLLGDALPGRADLEKSLLDFLSAPL